VPVLLASIIPQLHAGPKGCPRITVVVIIDQLAYEYLPKLKCYLRHGLRFFLDRSVEFKNAYYPHGMPSTSTGHTALNTGTYADTHGIIGNRWYDITGKVVRSDQDDSDDAGVFSPDGGTYKYGKSGRNILVDGISDQFVLKSTPCKQKRAYSVSLKSRASVATANKLGKAIWFDEHSGNFTSSKAYFDELPCWLKNFNKRKNLAGLSQIPWPLAYPCKEKPYCFYEIDNYKYSSLKKPLAGTTITLNHKGKDPFALFEITPYANQVVFNLAHAVVQDHACNHKCDDLLLWVCLSSLDKLGHLFGPDSKEVIDMIYHLDKQLMCFMDSIKKLIHNRDILWVVTSDHGVCPIPEIMKDQGIPGAGRVRSDLLIDEMNGMAKEQFEVEGLIAKAKTPALFLNYEKLNGLKIEQQNQVINNFTSYLMQQPGIKAVWTYDQLVNLNVLPTDHAYFFKRQLYPGRSGQIIIQTQPYVQLTDHDTGTSHCTPYEYDTHVPLMFYQRNVFEERVIEQKVWTLQLANTLAYLLGTNKPTASTMDILPGIILTDCIPSCG